MKLLLKRKGYLQVDCYEIDEKVEGYYPEFWEKHGKEWDEIFKTVDLFLDISQNKKGRPYRT